MNRALQIANAEFSQFGRMAFAAQGKCRRPVNPYSAVDTKSRRRRNTRATAVVCPSRHVVLGRLLSTTLPLSHLGCEVLRPLWANEAMHRACTMLQLVARLDRSCPVGDREHLRAASERRIASELEATFRALDGAEDSAVLPCSGLLRTLVRDLVELFASAASLVTLTTFIEPLLLPAYKRKALVLATCTLISDALMQPTVGNLSVTLRRRPPAAASLRISTEGQWPSLDESLRPCGIVGDLASLLESEPVADAAAVAARSVEIRFPIPWPQRRSLQREAEQRIAAPWQPDQSKPDRGEPWDSLAVRGRLRPDHPRTWAGDQGHPSYACS